MQEQARIPHNSESLKERFQEVYRDFFSKCALVCSAPRSVGLVGEYVGYEALAMRQVLPIRTYVGISPCHENRFEVMQYVTFDPEENTFHEHILEQDLKSQIEDKFLSQLRTIFPADSFH